jgi:hypothetical protein
MRLPASSRSDGGIECGVALTLYLPELWISARIRSQTFSIVRGTGSVCPSPSAADSNASTSADAFVSRRSAAVGVIQAGIV